MVGIGCNDRDPVRVPGPPGDRTRAAPDPCGAGSGAGHPRRATARPPRSDRSDRPSAPRAPGAGAEAQALRGPCRCWAERVVMGKNCPMQTASASQDGACR
ncbi:hypothetical protein GCM10019016_036850 [Streptomyces prasinosporus]|uniref:Uncharacterized protein n=1 Tax=Streptomyces prasinosporus TaxID=68256 RepID=A0ABP6TP63_9ACTN